MEELGLEAGYPGDEAWNRFVNAYTQNYLDENIHQLSKLLNNHLDIAIVIYGYFGMKEALRWVTSNKVSDLGSLRPIDCLGNKILLKRLKTVLMELP